MQNGNTIYSRKKKPTTNTSYCKCIRIIDSVNRIIDSVNRINFFRNGYIVYFLYHNLRMVKKKKCHLQWFRNVKFGQKKTSQISSFFVILKGIKQINFIATTPPTTLLKKKRERNCH